MNNNYYILLVVFNAIYSAIITIFNSIYSKRFNILNLLFIQYITTFISTLFIYLYLPKNNFLKLFTKQYYNIWLFNIFTSIFGIISWYYYYLCVNNIGPAKTQLIYSITKILSLFFISIFILFNSKFNFNIIIGILLSILGIYILEYNSNYM